MQIYGLVKASTDPLAGVHLALSCGIAAKPHSQGQAHLPYQPFQMIFK